MVKRCFRAAIAVSPRAAAAHHALGLTLTRLKKPEAALSEFRRAAELERARHGISMSTRLRCIPLASAKEAVTVLNGALKTHPSNREILQVLVSFSRMAGDVEAALGYAERLAVTAPDDHGLAALILDCDGPSAIGSMTGSSKARWSD